MPSNESENNLLAAFANFQPEPEQEIEYRFYYDPATRIGKFKTAGLPDREKESFIKHVWGYINDEFVTDVLETGDFVKVSREEYDDIAFSLYYQATLDGKVVKIPVEKCARAVLSLNDSGYKTVKDDMIFRVDDAYLGDSDHWTVSNTDNE